MAEVKKRKPLTKKVRFEVFKRDRFTCQYCGRMAPDIILEIDHIIPVAAGGTNDLLNLVTSCKDCNRGKGKRKLSDASSVRMQQAQLKELAKKREQLTMLLQWQKELSKFKNEMVTEIEKLYYQETGAAYKLTKHSADKVEKWIDKYGFKMVYDSAKIAINRCLEQGQNIGASVDMIPRICNMKKIDEIDPNAKHVNYLAKILANRFGNNGRLSNWNYRYYRDIIRRVVDKGGDIEKIRGLAASCYSLHDFKCEMEYYEYEEL